MQKQYRGNTISTQFEAASQPQHRTFHVIDGRALKTDGLEGVGVGPETSL